MEGSGGAATQSLAKTALLKALLLPRSCSAVLAASEYFLVFALLLSLPFVLPQVLSLIPSKLTLPLSTRVQSSPSTSAVPVAYSRSPTASGPLLPRDVPTLDVHHDARVQALLNTLDQAAEVVQRECAGGDPFALLALGLLEKEAEGFEGALKLIEAARAGAEGASWRAPVLSRITTSDEGLAAAASLPPLPRLAPPHSQPPRLPTPSYYERQPYTQLRPAESDPLPTSRPPSRSPSPARQILLPLS